MMTMTWSSWTAQLQTKGMTMMMLSLSVSLKYLRQQMLAPLHRLKENPANGQQMKILMVRGSGREALRSPLS